MSNFRVGMKVVCVNDTLFDEEPPLGAVFSEGLDGLRAGAVYTIRSIYIDPGYGIPLLRLNEIKRSTSRILWTVYESGYDPTRFRPVVERKTDISIFRAMLTPSKKKEHAR